MKAMPKELPIPKMQGQGGGKVHLQGCFQEANPSAFSMGFVGLLLFPFRKS